MSITTAAPATTGIKCGKCKGYHVNVAAVKACHLLDKPLAVTVTRPVAPLPTGGPLASAKQLGFLRTLCEERDTTLEHETDVAALTMAGASQLIKDLLATPKASKVPAINALVGRGDKNALAGVLPDVPAGRYAIEADGVVKFYRVDRPTEGQWAGHTFLKVQASDDLHRVRGTAVGQVLAAIAKDPREASLRYGREIGACGVCGRTLTDETSRANGIGPVCATKMEW